MGTKGAGMKRKGAGEDEPGGSEVGCQERVFPTVGSERRNTTRTQGVGLGRDVRFWFQIMGRLDRSSTSM